MTQQDNDQQYFAYLQQRSRLGHFYRRHWLYPRLCRQLSGRVLDVGCGIGDMLRFRPQTVGVDINRETVAACRAASLDAHLMQPDVLPFGARSFDGVILDNVLEHLVEPSPLLAEIQRVLRPAGRLLVGVPGPKGYRADPDHKVFYDRPALVARLNAAGFACQRILQLPLPGLGEALRSHCLYGVFHPR